MASKLVLLTALSMLLAPLALAVPAQAMLVEGCAGEPHDSDGDGLCDGRDTDDDNDGAPDVCDPHPKQYSDIDWVMYVVKGCSN